MPRSWRPTATRVALMQRADCLRAVREFMHERGVLEVQTPVLSKSQNPEPNIATFVAHPLATEASTPALHLRTSPEFQLKRLVAAGYGDVFEIGPVFRAGEMGARHEPEFTMLEWYRAGLDEYGLAKEVIDLIEALAPRFGRSFRVERTTYRKLFRDAIDIDPWQDDDESLRHVLGEACPAGRLDRDDLLDLARSFLIEPQLPIDQLTIVQDFPPTQAALATLGHRDGIEVARRFEVFVGSFEVANGYFELNDATEQRRRFDAQNQVRSERGDSVVPLDEALIQALEAGLPACAGVAVGFDRLLQALAGTDRIAAVMALAAGDDRSSA